MKPFDLEAAKAGAPVVTRDGREVKQLTVFEGVGVQPIFAVIENTIYQFDLNGSYCSPHERSHLDLFMAPKKVQIWGRARKHRITMDMLTSTNPDDLRKKDKWEFWEWIDPEPFLIREYEDGE